MRDTGGSIKRDERSGKWRLQWFIEDPATGQRKRIDKIFPTRAAASEWREEKRAELAGLAKAIPKPTAKTRRVTLASWFAELAGTPGEGYMDGRWFQSGRAANTVSTKAARWRAHVGNHRIAQLPLAAITRRDVREWLNEMRGKGLAPATVQSTMAVLVYVFNDAIREIDALHGVANPFTNHVLQTEEQRVQAAMDKQAAGGSALLTPEQFREAMKRLADYPLERRILALFCLSGLRLGEALALTRHHVDRARGVIVVDRAVKLEPNGAQTIGLPKRNKPRLVALCPTLAAILDEVQTKMILPAQQSDEAMQKVVLYRIWAEMRAVAKLPPTFTPKKARATHNNWIEKLMPEVSLSTRLEHMGHSMTGAEGGPRGVVVNIMNYTGYIPDSYAALRTGLDRILTG